MSFFAAIREGAQVVHRNWQLVLIQLAFMMVSFFSFFLIVGVPVAIAFIVFGLDLTDILRLRDVGGVFRDSSDLLGKYFGIALLVIMSFFVYLTFLVVLWVFTLGGTVGMLHGTILEAKRRFSLTVFFSEGKRFFSPILLFSSIMAIIFICLALVLGVIGGGASTVIDMARAQEATLALFLGVFFSLVLMSAGLFLILMALSLTVFGVAYIAFNRARPLETVRGTIHYLSEKPASIVFYGFLLLGYIVSVFLIILIGSPLTLLPVIGSILSLPYQLFTYVVQGYVSLVMLASAFCYYFRTGYTPSDRPSIEAADTSAPPAEGQALAPQEMEPPPQA